MGTFVFCVLMAAGAAAATRFEAWWPSASLERVPGSSSAINTEFQDGCPASSKDGLKLYIASNRPNGQGGLDIWVAERASANAPFGPPVNLGPPINTPANEFCPTPLTDGHTLLFVSTKPGGCGGSDIYVTRKHVNRGWQVPEPLGCAVNSGWDEASPFFVAEEDGGVLYFSSTRLGGYAADPFGATVGDSDIYVSSVSADGAVGAAALVQGVNSAVQDSRPHVRRDALELLFDSNRAGGFGANDIWSATRTTTTSTWSAPVNAGSNVNSAGDETRPYLSWGASTLYFGTTRTGVEGGGDIFFSTRLKFTGH
jgi:Tol biopolymer transport system component